MEDNKKSDTGCLILFILFIIGMIIYTISTTSAESFAETGYFVIIVGILAGAYFLIAYLVRKLSNDTETISSTIENTLDSKKGCLKAIGIGIIVLGLLSLAINTLATDFEINKGIGIAVTVIFIIIVGVYLYNAFQDS